MQSSVKLFLLNAGALLAGGLYLHHVQATFDRRLQALTSTIQDVSASQTASQRGAVEAVAAAATQTTIGEAAKRGTLAALATLEGKAVLCRPSKGEPQWVASEESPPPMPSPEAIRAFDEAGAIVTAGLRRKIWTEEDRLALEARLPLLDATLRDDVVRRAMQAANARLLDTSATHGQIF